MSLFGRPFDSQRVNVLENLQENQSLLVVFWKDCAFFLTTTECHFYVFIILETQA